MKSVYQSDMASVRTDLICSGGLRGQTSKVKLVTVLRKKILHWKKLKMLRVWVFEKYFSYEHKCIYILRRLRNNLLPFCKGSVLGFTEKFFFYLWSILNKHQCKLKGNRSCCTKSDSVASWINISKDDPEFIFGISVDEFVT